jgi:glycosyltransferase involved in cell wall biosynthesis
MSVPATIGIPFFNSSSTLADAIRSVYAQSYQDWELILADDGSSDDSLAIARQISDPRVRVISDGQNLGLAHRLNQITSAAQGEYLIRMDADDMMHPDRIQSQLDFLKSNPGVDVVGSGIYTINSANEPIGKRCCQTGKLTARGVLAGDMLCHPTVAARTTWFLDNPYDPAFRRAQDYELWCRTCARKKLQAVRLPEPMLFFREEGSVSLRKVLVNYRFARKVLWKYGPDIAGWTGTFKQIARNRLKGIAHCIFAATGRQMSLVNRRNSELPVEEQESVSSILKKILHTPLPGYPEQSRETGESASPQR